MSSLTCVCKASTPFDYLSLLFRILGISQIVHEVGNKAGRRSPRILTTC